LQHNEVVIDPPTNDLCWGTDRKVCLILKRRTIEKRTSADITLDSLPIQSLEYILLLVFFSTVLEMRMCSSVES
jgi:hypothetical protein